MTTNNSQEIDDDAESTVINSISQSKQYREFFREMDLNNIRLIEFGISDDPLRVNVSSSNVAEVLQDEV